MDSHGTWKPLLEGDLQSQALTVAVEIASEIASRNIESVCQGTLAGGHAGLARAFAYFHAVFPDHGFDRSIALYLNASLDYLAEAPLQADLYSGFTGIAWAAAQIDRQTGFTGDDDQFSQIDDLLLDMLSIKSWGYHYDLVSGLVGLGVYALERLPNPQARRCLSRIVEHLVLCAEHRPDGVTWLTPRRLLAANRHAARPNGEYNLGLAHGVPGVIALLSQAISSGVMVETATPIVEQAVRWLLTQKLPDSPGASFGYDAHAADCKTPSRSAWCYGDPGVATALFCTARNCDNSHWEQAAVELAIACGNRPESEMGVHDAAICHGWGGLAQIFNRLYQSTGDERLREAAIRFCKRTLEARRIGYGISGYAAWAGSTESWRDEVGFLEGAAGVALVLAAAASAVEPTWDSILLISNTVTQQVAKP